MRAEIVRDENRKVLLKKLRFRVIENGTVKALLDIIDTGEPSFLYGNAVALLCWRHACR